MLQFPHTAIDVRQRSDERWRGNANMGNKTECILRAENVGAAMGNDALMACLLGSNYKVRSGKSMRRLREKMSDLQ